MIEVQKSINATQCLCNVQTFCPMHGYTQEEKPWPVMVGVNKYGEPIWT